MLLLFTAGTQTGHAHTHSSKRVLHSRAVRMRSGRLPRAAGEMPVVLPQPAVDVVGHADIRARGGYLGLQDVDERAPARRRARALRFFCALDSFAFFRDRVLAGAFGGRGARHAACAQTGCIYLHVFFSVCFVYDLL